MRTPIQERLTIDNLPLLYDGAKGTFLKKYLKNGVPTDVLNLENPQAVIDLLKSYVDAGANIIQTNTFGANRYGLADTNYANRVGELNKKAAEIARLAAGENVYVAGDIGPTGKTITEGRWTKRKNNAGKPGFEKYITLDQAVETFKDQVRGLIDGGVDVLHIETMTQLPEVEAALMAIQEVAADKGLGHFPTIITMSFSAKNPKGGFLTTELEMYTPVQLAELASEYGVIAYGANCGAGIDEAPVLMQELRAGNDRAVLVSKLNVGVKSGEYVSPAQMAEHATLMHDMNVKVIGACCESNPEHIRAMANALRARGALTS